MKTIIIPILAATLAVLAFSMAAFAIALSGSSHTPTDASAPNPDKHALPLLASPTPIERASNVSGGFQWLDAAAWTLPTRNADRASAGAWPVFGSPGGSALAGLGLAVGSIIVILRHRSRIA